MHHIETIRQHTAAAFAAGRISQVVSTAAALVRTTSKAITGTRPPYVGVEIVKVDYLPLAAISAQANCPDGALIAADFNLKSDWIPVVRVEEWRQGTLELVGEVSASIVETILSDLEAERDEEKRDVAEAWQRKARRIVIAKVKQEQEDREPV